MIFPESQGFLIFLGLKFVIFFNHHGETHPFAPWLAQGCAPGGISKDRGKLGHALLPPTRPMLVCLDRFPIDQDHLYYSGFNSWFGLEKSKVVMYKFLTT